MGERRMKNFNPVQEFFTARSGPFPRLKRARQQSIRLSFQHKPGKLRNGLAPVLCERAELFFQVSVKLYGHLTVLSWRPAIWSGSTTVVSSTRYSVGTLSTSGLWTTRSTVARESVPLRCCRITPWAARPVVRMLLTVTCMAFPL